MAREEDEGERSLDALLGEIARAPNRSQPSELVGTTLGRYRIDALLGRGGMGIVYRAFDVKLSRAIALKVLPPDLLMESQRRARFLKEARLAAAVTHPCTAAVYDVGEEGATIFIAMELVEGRTVRAVLDDHPRGMPALEVARIGSEVARGLAKAHDAGIVHRDLKPENVMLDGEGQVKVLDFGLAKLREVEGESRASASTELGRVMGTPSYMSPEQAKGKRVDARSDLFSLGIILYEMLAGRRPFAGETTMEVLIAIDRDPPPPLTSARSDLPPGIAALIDRCLRKDPADRFQSAREVADELRQIAGTASTTRARVGANAGRRRTWAIALATGAVVGAVGYGASRSPSGRAASPRDATTAGTALAHADAVLACPVLQGSGVEEPAAWLGAAAASIACRRAVWILGGRISRTLAPAELLDLPRAPSDDFPRDVFAAAGTREKSVAAARARGAAWLDGSVARRVDGFEIRFVLRDPGGAEIARGEATRRSLGSAVAAAMSPLGLKTEALHPDVAKWTGITDPELLLLREDWRIGNQLGSDEGFDLLAGKAPALGADWEELRAAHARNAGEVLPPSAPPEIDRSSPATLARTAVARAATSRDVGVAVADELHHLFEKETSTFGRVALAEAEATVRYSLGDGARASDLMLGIMNDAVRDPAAWNFLTVNAYGHIGMHVLVKAYAAWTPEAADSWNAVAYTIDAADAAGRLQFARRAFELAPDHPLFATNYGVACLRLGRTADARAVAGRLMQGGDAQKRAGESLLILVEASEVRFRSALARAQALYESMPALGSIEAGTDVALFSVLEVATLAGAGTTLADLLAERFILSDPPRLIPGHFAPVHMLVICPRTRRELSPRCLARVRTLVEEGYFREGLLSQTRPLLDGLERSARGDTAGAATAFQPLIGNVRFSSLPFVVDAFERSGNADTAEKVDAVVLGSAGYNGATLAHLRAARRAAKRGDNKRARELAEKVIAAWSNADVPVEAVKEMRELLARTPGP